MKFSPLTILAATLALALAPAQAQIGSPSSRVQSLRAIETETPVFPQQLIILGVREGSCRVAISVSREGKLDDVLAVEYTHPEFAEVTMAAVKHWKFEPARFDGAPVDAATEVEVRFAVQGTIVVSVTALESWNARLHELMIGNPDLYRPRTLGELDRIPTPITTNKPRYPERMTHPGASAQVAVSFYIDESGTVRLPSVDANQDPELSAAAIDALRAWKFEPPTCKGRPVLVRATQTFNFQAPAKATASNS